MLSKAGRQKLQGFFKNRNTWLLLTAAVILLGASAFGLYKCPFRKLGLFYCPGCGMTRALFSFLKADAVLSFRYHPMLIPTLLFVPCAFFAWYRKQKKVLTMLVCVWAALMVLCWGWRLAFVFGKDPLWPALSLKNPFTLLFAS
jgi:hypothetical protein